MCADERHERTNIVVLISQTSEKRTSMTEKGSVRVVSHTSVKKSTAAIERLETQAKKPGRTLVFVK